MTTNNTGMSRTRNGPHRQRTHDLFPPRRRRGRASGRFREIWPGFRRVQPSFFGRYGYHVDALELQTQAFEELAGLAGTAAQTGQLEDAFAGFGQGASRLLLKGFADRLAKRRQLAFGTIGVPSPQAVQPAVAKRGDKSLDSGPTDP